MKPLGIDQRRTQAGRDTMAWWHVALIFLLLGLVALAASGCSSRRHDSISTEEAYPAWMDARLERGRPLPLDPEWSGEAER